VLANQAPWKVSLPLLAGLLVAPPIVVIAIGMVRARAIFENVAGQFGSAAGRLERAIARAKDAGEIAGVVRGFVARQCRLGSGAVDAENVVGAVRVSGRRNLAVRCERLLNVCENEGGAVPVDDDNNLDQLKSEAIQWLQDWQTESLRQRPRPNVAKFKGAEAAAGASLQSSSAKIVAAIVVIGSLFVNGQCASAEAVSTFDDARPTNAARVELSGQQQQTLLAEANKCYNTAREKVQTDSAEAKQGFADAADKYQLLVDGGVTNSRLYFNLANSYLESGQTGKAVANYLRCLRIDPTMREAQLNLAYAKKMLHTPASSADAKGSESSVVAYAQIGNVWLNSRVSPLAMFVATVVAWVAVWTFIGVRLLGYRFPWKSATCAAMLMFILAGTSSALSWQTVERQVAVVVQASAANAGVSLGQVVEPIQKRGDSTRVRTETGDTIWLPSDSVEII
jgi:tetratricopeptide (TPR) repeat protein